MNWITLDVPPAGKPTIDQLAILTKPQRDALLHADSIAIVRGAVFMTTIRALIARGMIIGAVRRGGDFPLTPLGATYQTALKTGVFGVDQVQL